MTVVTRWVPLALTMLMLAACAGTPPVPDWQMNAHGALQRSVQALLQGNDRIARAEFDRARGEIAATGRPALMARAELLQCAAWAASLRFEPCTGFERLRADADAADRAYADHLFGSSTSDAARQALLPPAQQRLAAMPAPGAAVGAGAGDLQALRTTADPLSRLVAAALWQRDGRATPEVLALAVDTASEQGWRRPLLAWLRVQQQRAIDAGNGIEASRIGRRIELVLQGVPAP